MWADMTVKTMQKCTPAHSCWSLLDQMNRLLPGGLHYLHTLSSLLCTETLLLQPNHGLFTWFTWLIISTSVTVVVFYLQRSNGYVELQISTSRRMLQWKSNWYKVIGLVVIAWISFSVIHSLLKTEEKVPPVVVDKGLGRVLNEDGTFSIMDRVK